MSAGVNSLNDNTGAIQVLTTMGTCPDYHRSRCPHLRRTRRASSSAAPTSPAADGPYHRLKRALRAQIDEAAWS